METFNLDNNFWAWAILITSFFIGSLGTLLPGLPGATIIFFGVIAHKFLLPPTFSWVTVSIVGALALISWIVDFLAGVWGAKLGGATRKGLIGAAIGGFLGIFWGIPGLIIGPFIGAVTGDLIAKRNELSALLKSGFGASLGFFMSIIARFIILLILAVVITIAVIV